MGLFDRFRERTAQARASQTGAQPEAQAQQPQAPADPWAGKSYADMAKEGFGFTGWDNNTGMDFDGWNAKANQFQAQGGATAGLRDWMSGEFQNWYQPKAAAYRQQFGEAATNDDDAGLMKSEGFRSWLGGGAGPQTQQAPGSQYGGLQSLMEQMIANQKQNADRAASRDQAHQQWSDQMRGNIMDRYNRVNQDVNMNDPRIQRQQQNFDAMQQRQFNAGREAMAARGAVQGTPQGASDASLQSSVENMARASGDFGAGLMQREYDNQRSEINNLLQLGTGLLSDDENRMLRDRLGTVDLAMRERGLDQNNALGWASLDQGNRHFYDNMGYNAGLQEAVMNQRIMEMLMGGGGY